jgi:hypothetical protein
VYIEAHNPGLLDINRILIRAKKTNPLMTNPNIKNPQPVL